MKKAVIVHCWGGYPKYCWYPQTKQELEKLGFSASIPAMPNTDNPLLHEWLPELEKHIDKPNTELILIGHSLGCITIMRYLEKQKPDVQIGGVIFVAGFTDDLQTAELKNFFVEPINFEKIKSHAKHFTLIASDNDPYVGLHFANILKSKLDAEVIIKKSMGHFSGEIDNEKSCISLPDVTRAVKKML